MYIYVYVCSSDFAIPLNSIYEQKNVNESNIYNNNKVFGFKPQTVLGFNDEKENNLAMLTKLTSSAPTVRFSNHCTEQVS